jgi:hypothetical protein
MHLIGSGRFGTDNAYVSPDTNTVDVAKLKDAMRSAITLALRQEIKTKE